MSRLQAAVFQVLEGFTLSDDVRKILEAAYHSDDTFAQGRAAGLEEAAKQIWIECVAAADDNDLRIYTLLSELRKSILSLSPTPSDAGKDDAQIVEQTSCQECGGRRIVLRHVNSHRDDTEPCQKCAALSSLEVIGKGEKG